MYKKLAVTLAIGLLFAATLTSQQITDPKEYEDYVKALNETDKAKKVQLLTDFVTKYPKTVMKEQALELKLRTQQADGKMGAETAKEILTVNPNNTTASLVLSYAFMQTPLSDTDPQFQQKLSEAEATAKHGIEATAAMPKPANASDADFTASKNLMTSTHYQALGLIGLYRKDYDAGIDGFKKAGEATPNDASLAYRIGDSYDKEFRAAKSEDEKIAKAQMILWYFARASALEGPGALNAQAKATADSYLTRFYKSFHGSDEGLAQLKEQAKAQFNPPGDFHVKTKAEMQPAPPPPPPEPAIPDDVTKMPFGQVMYVLAKDDDKAHEVFGKLKGIGMALDGVIVSSTPPTAPKTIHVAVLKKTQETAGAYDVVLSLAAATTALKAGKGRAIEFEGVVKEYKENKLVIGEGKITSSAAKKP